jgi:hypothetical protein
METHTIMASDDPIVRTEHACPQCSFAGDTACVEAVARLRAERDALRVLVEHGQAVLFEADGSFILDVLCDEGHDKAVAAQEWLGRQFAEAINACADSEGPGEP